MPFGKNFRLPRPQPKAKAAAKELRRLRRAIRRRRPARAPQGNRKAGGRYTAAHLHPVFTQKQWVPRALKMTPTTRVGETALFTIPCNASTATVCLIGPTITVANGDLVSPQSLGFYGTGTQVPFSTSVTIAPVILGSLGTYGGRIRVHRIGVTVGCSGPTAVGVLVPGGYMRFGALRGPMEIPQLPNISGIATFLDSKPELHMRTAHELLYKPVHISARPLDRVQWGELMHMNNAAPVDFLDTLTIIALAFPPDATLTSYTVAIHAEYDFLVNEDGTGGPIVSASAVLHPSVTEEAVDGMMAAGLAVSGLVGEGAVSALGMAGRAAPVLADLAPLVAL
jgi:hypothetical protein